MLRRRLRLRRPFRSGRRGQGLVEFALIAPLILLILLVTIDFGRALYGWVVLQNSSRIAANFAGLNPDAWKFDVQVTKDRYAALIVADLKAANCDSFGSGAGAGGPAPDPQFIDGPDVFVSGGPPDTVYDVGDIARVNLECTFHPITPIISAIVGNNFQLGATSEFRIRSGIVTGMVSASQVVIPPPGASASASASVPGCVVVPDLVNNGAGTETVSEARAEWTAAGFTGSFTPASGVPNKIVLTQTLSPAANIGECVSPTTSVTVTNT